MVLIGKNMDKEKFISLLKEHDSQVERIDLLQSIGLNIYDSPLIEYGNFMFDEVIKAYFTEEGDDWISWFIYEKNGDPEIKAFDNGKEIPLETYDDLWELVKEYVK
jgi:predicted methyltransferase